MSENLKVNSKTQILDFKRKHNKIVDELPVNAQSGTISSALGLDSNGKLVKGSVSGGTKLYKHLFTIQGEMEHYEITIINNSSNAITSLGNVGELLKGLITKPTDPDPIPQYFIFIKYEEETEIGSAYHLIPANILIPDSGTTYSTDEITPL